MPPPYWPPLLIGAALCLGGWVIYWLGLHLTGALVGAAAGMGLAWAGCLISAPDPAQTLWIVPLAGVVGFVLGIVLIRGLHRFFFFFAGAVIGLTVSQGVWRWAEGHTGSFTGDPALWQAAAGVGGALLGGVVLLLGSRWVVALVTSCAGAVLVVVSIPDPLALLGLIPLALVSFLWQMGILRRMDRRPSRDEWDEEDD